MCCHTDCAGFKRITFVPKPKLPTRPPTTVKYPANEPRGVLHAENATFSNPSYWLCTTPRSGSSALGDALEQTGVAGRPTEYFNRRFWPELFEHFGIATASSYLDAVTTQTATVNGVFGVKVMLDADADPTFDALRERLFAPQLSDADAVQRAFPGLRFVYLTRRDKVRQAVSYVRANTSGVWARYRGEAPSVAAGDAKFDFAALNGWVHELALREARWQRFFDEVEATPYTVVYEDYVRAPERAVRGILDFLGLEPAPDWSLPELPQARLADEVSEAWVTRYYEHSDYEHSNYEHSAAEGFGKTEPNR